jgi:hypothetical protein
MDRGPDEAAEGSHAVYDQQRKRTRDPDDLEHLGQQEDEEEHQQRDHQLHEQHEEDEVAQRKPRKRRSPSWKLRVLTFKDLQQHFDKPLHVAAKILGTWTAN